jgi:hypothetical protein
MNSIHLFPHHFSKIHSNIILTSILRSYKFSSLQDFLPKLCMHFASIPCVLHAPSHYLVKRRSYKAPNCVFFSSFLPLAPTLIEIFSSVPLFFLKGTYSPSRTFGLP